MLLEPCVRAAALLLFFLAGAGACGPGRFGGRRRLPRKLTPLVFKEHVPNVPEFTLGAAGPPEGRITRDHPRFRDLIPNYSSDITYKDEEGNGEDRIMSQRCLEKLNTLAISVMNMYPGLRLRVTEAYDEEALYHAPQSLHYEGRAIDFTTSDRDRSKLGMLARLAVEAGFDYVYYESRSHIHASVKSESADAARSGGCFSGRSLVRTSTGTKTMEDLNVGEQVLVTLQDGSLLYSEVLLFLDRDEKQARMHVVIVTETGKQLTLTPKHLIFVTADENSANIGQGFVTFAKDVEIGDFVYVHSDNSTVRSGVEKVANISISYEVGVYAPLTSEGNIVVNDVICSCYAIFNDQEIAHMAFSPIRMAKNFKTAVLHASQKLQFLKFRNKKKSRTKEATNGIHWYAAFLYDIAHNFLPENYL